MEEQYQQCLEEHNSLSLSTWVTKLFFTAPAVLPQYPVQSTCILTCVVVHVPTKNRIPRSRQEGSTLHWLLFGDCAVSVLKKKQKNKKGQNATILKSPICWGRMEFIAMTDCQKKAASLEVHKYFCLADIVSVLSKKCVNFGHFLNFCGFLLNNCNMDMMCDIDVM